MMHGRQEGGCAWLGDLCPKLREMSRLLCLNTLIEYLIVHLQLRHASEKTFAKITVVWSLLQDGEAAFHQLCPTVKLAMLKDVKKQFRARVALAGSCGFHMLIIGAPDLDQPPLGLGQQATVGGHYFSGPDMILPLLTPGYPSLC